MRSFSYAYEETSTHDPHRVLRLAVLSRAIGDLSSTSRYIVRQTIGWFRSAYRGNRNGKFTWAMLKDDLELSAAQLEFIEGLIRYAEDYTPDRLVDSSINNYTACKPQGRPKYRVDK